MRLERIRVANRPETGGCRTDIGSENQHDQKWDRSELVALSDVHHGPAHEQDRGDFPHHGGCDHCGRHQRAQKHPRSTTDDANDLACQMFKEQVLFEISRDQKCSQKEQDHIQPRRGHELMRGRKKAQSKDQRDGDRADKEAVILI
jgi:hypothetical protein